MRKIALVILIVGLVLMPAPVLAQTYGSNMCRWVCNQTYPEGSPQRFGCHLYCDWYCSQPENEGVAMCLDIQDV